MTKQTSDKQITGEQQATQTDNWRKAPNRQHDHPTGKETANDSTD